MQLGDATIIVKSNCITPACKHSVALQMHEQIAAGDLTMYIKKANNSNSFDKLVIPKKTDSKNPKPLHLLLVADECLIGIYEEKRTWGTFIFQLTIHNFINNKIVFNVQ